MKVKRIVYSQHKLIWIQLIIQTLNRTRVNQQIKIFCKTVLHKFYREQLTFKKKNKIKRNKEIWIVHSFKNFLKTAGLSKKVYKVRSLFLLRRSNM